MIIKKQTRFYLFACISNYPRIKTYSKYKQIQLNGQYRNNYSLLKYM